MTTQWEVRFLPSGTAVQAAAGTTLLDAARKAGLSLDAPCGGQGTCGKCEVLVKNGTTPGRWRACQFPVTEPLLVEIPDSAIKASILTGGAAADLSLDPPVRSVSAAVERCPAGRASSDCRRVQNALGKRTRIPLSVAKDLFSKLESSDYCPNFVLFEDTLLELRPNDGPLYILACDIGTTTVVSYLLDAKTGRQLAVSSKQNPQASYGADVISRGNYSLSDKENRLTRLIQECIDELCAENCGKAGIQPREIYFAALAGNTCMQHLYLGVSPASLLHAPYNATVDDMQVERACDFGLHIHPEGRLAFLPAIAGFVGADTVGVLLSLPPHTFDELTLVLDIGTNGEMVLGKGGTLFTCSTAAGPAFEGAKIECGMRGGVGAIDHVWENRGTLQYSVIGGGKPSGICGSGLIDLTAVLLSMGLLLPNGRFSKTAPVVMQDGMKRLPLTKDGRVFLSQKDVRELQLAKAAIATGILMLCEKMAVRQEEIQKILLAGAFGTYLSPESACRIGLIPGCLSGRITAIGNAAGEGAKAAALNREKLHGSRDLAQKVHFLELAAEPAFQAAYLRQLNFPNAAES